LVDAILVGIRSGNGGALALSGRRLDCVEDLANAIVGHILKDSNSALLAGVQQRIDIREELFLIQLKFRVREIEVVYQALHFIIGRIARDCEAQLIQSASPALADFKSVVDELLKERQDLGEHFVGDFAGLYGLLKLIDVKAQHGLFDYAPWRAIGSHWLLQLLLTAQRTAVRSRDNA